MSGLDKIIFHWSAGTYVQSKECYEHYHFTIGIDGKLKKGKYLPEDNVNCLDKRYARHTGGGNTGSIGIALLGMAGFKNFKMVGKYPLTKKQCEASFCAAAALCKKYGIDIKNVTTHYEFGLSHPKTDSAGKIDIIYLPPYPLIKTNEVAGFIRKKVKWYHKRLLIC